MREQILDQRKLLKLHVSFRPDAAKIAPTEGVRKNARGRLGRRHDLFKLLNQLLVRRLIAPRLIHITAQARSL